MRTDLSTMSTEDLRDLRQQALNIIESRRRDAWNLLVKQVTDYVESYGCIDLILPSGSVAATIYSTATGRELNQIRL